MVESTDRQTGTLAQASPTSFRTKPASSMITPRPSRSLRDRAASAPDRRTIELAQRGRMILDVAVANLDAAEAAHGAFHATTSHLRDACNEARRCWERLRAQLGTKGLEAAINQPPITSLALGEHDPTSRTNASRLLTLVIAGQTYCAQRVIGTELAPVQWRLTRPNPPLEDGPYYVCRLANRTTQCDCAEWIYHISGNGDTRNTHCKHLAALATLGWI